MNTRDDDILEGEVVDQTPKHHGGAKHSAQIPVSFGSINNSSLTACLLLALLALAVTAVAGWFVLLIPLVLGVVAWWYAKRKLKR